MSDEPLDSPGNRDRRERIVDQFSGRGERADVWRALGLFVDTSRYLNLGYAGECRPYPVGNPQLRLVRKVAATVEAALPAPAGARVLDVGCGRGGPALRLADELAADVTGIDVVGESLAIARENAATASADVAPSFVVADAVALPFVDGAFDACTAIDSIVYVSEKAAVFEELGRVTRPGGAVVVSDLVRDDPVEGEDGAARRRVEAFADAWDMPPLPSRARYLETVERSGLTIEALEDASPHSIDRFRKWSALYLRLVATAGGLVERALGRWELDVATMTEQIRLAHEAIPDLAHVVFRARRP